MRTFKFNIPFTVLAFATFSASSFAAQNAKDAFDMIQTARAVPTTSTEFTTQDRYDTFEAYLTQLREMNLSVRNTGECLNSVLTSSSASSEDPCLPIGKPNPAPSFIHPDFLGGSGTGGV
jgi:hypothetical protein